MTAAEVGTFSSTQTLHYGTSPSQFLVFHTPLTQPPFPLVVLIHGGFWKSKYGLSTKSAAIETLAPDLVRRDIAAAEIEYRRSGEAGWGFPGTNDDVLQAFLVAIQHHNVDKSKVFLVGHSAGGTLALWLTARLQELGDVKPLVTFALAPVSDLRKAAEFRLSDDGDAVQNYMGGEPHEVPDKYTAACPMEFADLLRQVDVVVISGEKDVDVPPEIVKRIYHKVTSSEDVLGHWQYKNFDCDHIHLTQASNEPWQYIVNAIAQRRV